MIITEQEIWDRFNNTKPKLNLNPNLSTPWFGMGWMLVWDNRFQEGREAILESLHLDPSDALNGRKYVALAASYLGENNLEEAKKAIDKAVTSNVQWPAFVIQASLYASLGQVEVAKPILSKVLLEQDDLTISTFASNTLLGSGPAVDKIIEGLEIAGLPR